MHERVTSVGGPGVWILCFAALLLHGVCPSVYGVPLPGGSKHFEEASMFPCARLGRVTHAYHIHESTPVTLGHETLGRG
jgi:hypothetical protein